MTWKNHHDKLLSKEFAFNENSENSLPEIETVVPVT